MTPQELRDLAIVTRDHPYSTAPEQRRQLALAVLAALELRDELGGPEMLDDRGMYCGRPLYRVSARLLSDLVTEFDGKLGGIK